ncbi:S9 family peptidase [Stappia indica]|uniref:S9 family peptidase n=1 Tax=Stappia indica TaxID=538381 RepID=UPI001CD23BFF|nr:prolyl oligopeptidase family serine peptidase [Stappia indica]MCA1299285.1 prolyl oligopeptidase family serine peptidase [Stappia indica]
MSLCDKICTGGRGFLRALVICLAFGAASSTGQAGDDTAGNEPAPGPDAYARVRSLGAPLLNRTGERLYTGIYDPDRGAHIIRYDLASDHMTSLFSIGAAKGDNLLVDGNETRMAFTLDAQGDEQTKLHIVDLDTGAYRVPTPRDKLDLPCGFSPDGADLYTARGAHMWGEKAIYRIDAETGRSEMLYAEPGRWLQCLEVTPDGKKLILLRFVTNDEQHLGLLDLESGETDWFLEEANVRVVGAQVYRGGYYILANREGGPMRPWVYDGAGGFSALEVPVAGELTGFGIGEPGMMALIYRDGLKPRVSLYAADEATGTGGWTPVEVDPAVGDVTAFIVPRETRERFYFLAEDGRPPVLYVQEKGKARPVLDTNLTGLPDSAFARYRSELIPSFDGTPIPTHIMIPDGASAENPMPMVMVIHGGPRDHVDPLYSAGNQILAAQGFVVVLPNVRGSSGFGKAFMDMDNGDWGGGHIRDILAVADHVAKMPEVKGRPRFIMGGSFGGFSVLSAITQYPEAFDGAVDIFGISDVTTFIEGMPEQVRPYFLEELGFDPREDTQRARALSPLFHAERIRVPLQIHQGANDRRVLPEQSRRLAETLRKAGIEVEYFEYPDEGHGFDRQHNSDLSRQRMVEFFVRLRDRLTQ